MPVDTVDLARALIGTTLVRREGTAELAGRIVETEAYVLGDASSHAYRGVTARTASMFRQPGTAYVYFIYGTWFCLNVASEVEGVGAAVLLRALEPLAGQEEMRRRSGVIAERDLARGPGRLCRALGIDRSFDGLDLCSRGPLFLAKSPSPPRAIGESVRIGLSREADRVLRFYERENPHVSGPLRLRV